MAYSGLRVEPEFQPLCLLEHPLSTNITPRNELAQIVFETLDIPSLQLFNSVSSMVFILGGEFTIVDSL